MSARVSVPIVLLLALLLCSQANARNWMVMGQDQDPLSLPHASRPFKTAIDILKGRLASYDVVVYDEAAIRSRLNIPFGASRDDAAALDIAKASKSPPIDIVVVLALYADRTEASYGSKFDLRMTAKMLAVSTGKVIGTTSSRTLEPTPLPAGYGDNCFLEAYSGKVEALALDLVDQIVRFVPKQEGLTVDCEKGPCPAASAVHLNEYKVVLRYPTEELAFAFEKWGSSMPGIEVTPIQSDRAQQSYWVKSELSPLQMKSELSTLKRRLKSSVEIRLDGSTFELRVPN